MNILIAILPALFWGFGPILATLMGGKPIHQVVGTGYGQLVIGVILYLLIRPAITLNDFVWLFLGGALWSIAQLMQFTSFKQLNVSVAMPISTGLQLIEIPLAGVIFWGEWAAPADKWIGFVAIILLIIGISMTSVNDHLSTDHMDYKGGLTMLIVGSFGYTACSVFPRIPNANGIVGLLPQTLGMFLGAAVMGLIFQCKHHQNIMLNRSTIKNMVVGLFGGLGTFLYLVSLKENGVATSFPLTQLNVVVSTLGGIFILHEHKDHKELSYTLAGLVIIIVAAVMIGHIS